MDVMLYKKPESDKKNYGTSDLLVVSHLRWNFVFQRPQHLMSRFANRRRVFFLEEPIFEHIDKPELRTTSCPSGVKILVPHLPFEYSPDSLEIFQAQALEEFMTAEEIEDYTLWYYTPMALPFTRHLQPKHIIYDCMDELSLFKGAPRALIDNEAELMVKADLIFTGGHTLYEAKKHLHDNIHPFPSSIDASHFGKARQKLADPIDQRNIQGLRVGFFGVIDERMDLQLLEGAARLRPEWQWIMLGPIVKIDPAHLPKRDNIHYLGNKQYKELPDYIAGWDVAMMPFARNESTRFISPTKTPEYLAAGRPVISTSIRDVINPYAVEKLVRIADTPRDFVLAAEGALQDRLDPEWLKRVDRFLQGKSWDETWARMASLEVKLDRAETKANFASWGGMAQPAAARL